MWLWFCVRIVKFCLHIFCLVQSSSFWAQYFFPSFLRWILLFLTVFILFLQTLWLCYMVWYTGFPLYLFTWLCELLLAFSIMFIFAIILNLLYFNISFLPALARTSVKSIIFLFSPCIFTSHLVFCRDVAVVCILFPRSVFSHLRFSSDWQTRNVNKRSASLHIPALCYFCHAYKKKRVCERERQRTVAFKCCVSLSSHLLPSPFPLPSPSPILLPSLPTISLAQNSTAQPPFFVIQSLVIKVNPKLGFSFHHCTFGCFAHYYSHITAWCCLCVCVCVHTKVCGHVCVIELVKV